MLDLVRTVWLRRRWLAILVFAVPFTAAVSFAAFLPNIYQSTATVLVERQQVPEMLVRPTVTSELETRLRTISQEILSRSRLEGLITRFGLYTELRKSLPLEAVIERMRRDVRLELTSADARVRGATIAFAISYRGQDPDTVAQVTNTLASFYIEENLKARERQATGTAEFLKVQLNEIRKRLDDQERQVSEFKKRYVGELPQQMPANLATIEQLNAQLRLNSVSRIRLEEKRELLAMQLPELSPTGPARAAALGPSAAPESPRSRLTRSKEELAELSTRFTEKHPDVVLKKAEVAALERQIAADRALTEAKADDKVPAPDEPAPALSPQGMRLKQALGETDAELKVLKDEDKRLRSALASYEQRVTNIPRREQELLELSRDYDGTRELYQSLAKRHDEAQLAENLEQRQKGEQFRILDPALASALPAAPNRVRWFLVACVLSLGLAGGVVLLAEELDTSFHSLEALRAFTTVAVLASIPRLVTEADAHRRRWHFRLAATGTTLGLAVLVGASYFFAHGNERLILW